MKKFKKLIPALCMLLVSAVLVGTSTYAWFSMQESVTVTGLSVTAQTNDPYLIIGTGDNNTVAKLQGLITKTTPEGDTVDLGVSGDAAKVKPVAHKDLNNKADNAADYANWFWKAADKTSESASTKAENEVKEADFGDYVIEKTVYMTIAPNTPEISDIEATVAITRKTTEGDKKIEAARVLLAVYSTEGENTAVDKGVKEFPNSDAAATSLATDSVKVSTLITVKIYIYIDGTDPTIFTDNIDALDTAEIKITFKAIV